MLPTLFSSRTLSGGTDWASETTDLFDRFLTPFFAPRLGTLGAPNVRIPASDLYETDEEFVLEMEMPGFARDAIEVTVERGILTVTGRRAAVEAEEERLTYHVQERAPNFSRSFALPQSVDAEKVSAEYQNGILCVRVPKAAEARPHRVKVRS